MGTVRRQSIQTTIVMFTGVILGFGLKLILFPAYLSPEEIGLLTVLLNAANLFAAFIPLGSQKIFMRYRPVFQKKGEAPKGLLYIGAILTGVGLAVFLLLFFLFREPVAEFYRDKAALLSDYFLALLPLVIARVLFRLAMEYSKAIRKIVVPVFLKEIGARLLTAILVMAFAWKWFDINGLVFWYVLIYFVIGSIMTYYIFAVGKANLKPDRDKMRGGQLKEILNFGMFAVFTSGSTVLVKNLDSLMITSLATLSDAGIYAIAFFIGTIIELPRRALSYSTGPVVAQAFNENKMGKINELYHKTSLNQLILGLFMVIVIWINIDALFEIMPNGSKYAEGKYVVLFIALAYLVDMSAGINQSIIQQSPRYRFNFYIMTSMIALTFLTNYFLIPLYGIEGAALATLSSYLVINLFRALVLWYYYKLQPLNVKNSVAVLLGIILYFATFLLPELESPILSILLKTSLFGIAYWGLVILLRVSVDYRNLFESLVKRYLR